MYGSKTKCAGKVKTYAFDIDLPKLNLCERHKWELIFGNPDEKRDNRF